MEKEEVAVHLFKKKVLRNRKTGERKIEFQNVSQNLTFYNYTLFSDFIYNSELNVDGIYTTFQQLMENDPNLDIENMKEELDFMNKNFCNIFPPKYFCKEYAYSNYPFKY